jgi:hypothetical protein
MPKMVTGEQLRAEIDAGKTGDKVPFPDPATAPLETDAEAGGRSTLFPSERRRTEHSRDRKWGGLAFYIGAVTAIAFFVIILAAAIN